MLTKNDLMELQKYCNESYKYYWFITNFNRFPLNTDNAVLLQISVDSLEYYCKIIFHSLKQDRLLTNEEKCFFRDLNYLSNLRFYNYKESIRNKFKIKKEICSVSNDLLFLFEICCFKLLKKIKIHNTLLCM